MHLQRALVRHIIQLPSYAPGPKAECSHQAYHYQQLLLCFSPLQASHPVQFTPHRILHKSSYLPCPHLSLLCLLCRVIHLLSPATFSQPPSWSGSLTRPVSPLIHCPHHSQQDSWKMQVSCLVHRKEQDFFEVVEGIRAHCPAVISHVSAFS